MAKYLIVGLGNPGKKYENTRHNVGRMFLKEFIKRNTEIDGELVKVFIPKSFMNVSGASIKLNASRDGIDPEHIVIFHDDMDIEVGKYKIQKGVNSAGHNGVQSIIDEFKTNNFWRVRIGIGHPRPEEDPKNYVLNKLPNADKNKILKIIDKVAQESKKIFD